MADTDFAALADELEAACADHTRGFAANGYCKEVADANDRISKVHDAYARMAGSHWRDGNERLIARLRHASA